jgi:diacylglycerol kinase (ATP)
MTGVPERLFVHNPASRNGSRIAGRVRAELARQDPASAAGACWVALQDLPSFSSLPGRVIVVGGDGSINAAATWLRSRGWRSPLAIVPAGTGNNLARGLGVPLETSQALRLAIHGAATRQLDAILYRAGGTGETRLWVQSAALGFPAEIAARYDALRRHRLFRLLCRPAGPYVYRVLAFLGLAGQKRNERLGTNLLEVECATADERLRETVFAIFLGNDGSLGGNFHPCPRAVVDDGALDLCLIRAGTGAKYLKLFRSIVRGEHLTLEKTVVYRQIRGPLSLSLNKPCRFLADGDLWVESDWFDLEVEARRFQVIVG